MKSLLACISFLVLLYSWEINGIPYETNKQSRPQKNKWEGKHKKAEKIPPLKYIVNEDKADYQTAFALASAVTANLQHESSELGDTKLINLSKETQESIVSSINYGDKEFDEKIHRIRSPATKKTFELTEKILRCDVDSLKHHISKCRKRVTRNSNSDQRGQKRPFAATRSQMELLNANVRKTYAPTKLGGKKKPHNKFVANSTMSTKDFSTITENSPCQSGCGGCINVSSAGFVLQSVNYPGEYSNNLACNYSIGVPVGARMRLTFTVFQVEQDYDFLTLYDSQGNRLRSSMTGYNPPPIFTTKTNQILINFVSDGDNIAIPENTTPSWSISFQIIYPLTTTSTTTATSESTSVTPESTSVTSESSSVTPDSSSVTPDSSSVSPDSSSVTPDSSSVTPDSSSVTPDSSSVTPDSSSITPDSSSVTPDSSSVTPDSSSVTPDSSSVTPDSSSVTPDSSSVTPDSSSVTPDSSSVTPDSSSVTPDSSSVTPDSSSVTPDSSSVTPDSSSVTPDSSSVTPDSSSVTPDSSSVTPDSSSVTPDSSSVTPDSSSVTPDSSSVTPDSSSVTPESTSVTSESTSESTSEPSTTTTPEPLNVFCDYTPAVGADCPAVNPCINVTNSGGYVQSSFFPNDYAPSSDCQTVITVPEGKKIDIEFVYFSVENLYDSLRIQFLDPSQAEEYFRDTQEFTGYNLPDSIHIKSHKVKIVSETDVDNDELFYETDGYGTGSWLIRFIVITPTPTPTVPADDSTTEISVIQTTTPIPSNLGYSIAMEGPCKGNMGSFINLTPSGGTILSPNYPNTYLSDDDCDFIILIDGGARKRIAVSFVAHTLELYYDVLRIYDDSDDIDRSYTTGLTLPEDVIIKSNRLKIKFYSDENNSELPSGNIARWQLKFQIGTPVASSN